ncbi:MAG TPA: DUF655 domain-containing protein [Candidatus Thermoplasmatota archaeon]|nr:DUF655 domain-containing protein [Candidatus Thermoplasmatota archaeon]
MEEFAYILDYLPRGRPDNPRSKDPVAYAVGEQNFVILELEPKAGATLLVGDRVYLGRDPAQRDKIDRVRGRIKHEEMTHSAQSELRFVLEDIVKKNEARFVKFFNDAGPITMRMHTLELLPGLGKKLMWAIINERKKGPFQTFEDMANRVKALHQPAKLIAHRIETEVTDTAQKYHLFALPFVEREGFGPPGRR